VLTAGKKQLHDMTFCKW